ncbi:hypothetical protein QBC43DRAFT_306794 [Cladorrhinum sp. PSN259]|nr:hypothetical protein QBC43DRAFT_306794 [Cladorrhinum sp. PSN259]
MHINSHHDPPTRKSCPSDAKYERIRIIERVGNYSAIILLGGTIVIIGCMGFLTLLWTAKETNAAWRQIVVSGWLTKPSVKSSTRIRQHFAPQAATPLSWQTLPQHSCPEYSRIYCGRRAVSLMHSKP